MVLANILLIAISLGVLFLIGITSMIWQTIEKLEDIVELIFEDVNRIGRKKEEEQ